MEENSQKIIIKNENDAITTIKLLFGVLGPVGTFLNETIFEHHSRIKQNRINSFCEKFISYLQMQGLEKIDIEKINAEDFGDIFEIIIRKVSQTNSDEKTNRFKKILAKQIINPNKDNFTETYVELIGKLSESQIAILLKHSQMEPTLKLAIEKLDSAKSDNNLKLIEEGKSEFSQLQYFRKANYYNLSDGEYLFSIQDLVAKALLSDIGLGLASSTGQYKAMKITEYGEGLLKFINAE